MFPLDISEQINAAYRLLRICANSKREVMLSKFATKTNANGTEYKKLLPTLERAGKIKIDHHKDKILVLEQKTP
jgi:DNA-binding IclR family transcriptional regulator